MNWQTLNGQSFVKPSSNNAWSGTNSFNTSIPTTTINATANNQIVNWQTLNGQSFTTLALVQSNANTFTGTSNTFSNPINANGQVNIKNNLLVYDLALGVKYTRISQSGDETTFKHFGGSSSQFTFETLNASSNPIQSLLLSSTTATIPINLAVSGNTTMSGTASISSNLTLRATKLYNKVNVITTNVSLSFPLEETSVINTTSNITITLPTITANSLGMTFYFLKNETSSFITFTASSTDTIVLNGSKTGSTTQIVMNKGQTSCQLTCLQYFVGAVNNWVEIVTSLPRQMSNPPGSILTMAIGTLPEGYLPCDLSTYNVLLYPDLYAVIGNTFGGTAGVNFSTPNYNGYAAFLRGKGVGAAAYGTLQNSNIKTHTHDILFGYDDNIQGSGGSGTCYNSTGPSYNNPGPGAGRATGITENNTPGTIDDTYPVNYAVYYCIKY